MSLLANLKTISRQPGILPAYLQWCAWRSVGRVPRPAFRKQAKQWSEASIGEWLSFSEYWTYRELIPRSEERLLIHALTRADQTPAFALSADKGAVRHVPE